MTTTLTSGQAEIRADTDEALVVGDATSYMWVQQGPAWWGAPEVRTFDQPRSNADGSVAGRDLLGSHASTLQVNILGSSETDIGDKIDTWKAACAKSDGDEMVAVRMNVLGRTRVRYGRFRRPGEVDATLARTGYVAVGSAQFEALDPRTYGDTEYSATTGREIPGAGIVLPATLPWTLPAGSSGAIALVNNGKTAAPWTARIDGPLTQFTINHLEFGQRLAFTANGGIDLATGEYVLLSSDGHSVLYAGTADRRSALTLDSSWWELGYGINNIRVAANSGTGTVAFAWRDAWNS